jgi:uncharacterized protein YfaS (alpha-2-macroglobulin family)
MSSSYLRSLKILLITGSFFLITNARAQNKYEVIDNRIDSLAGVGLPKSALKEVDKLEKLARANNNTPQQIRAVIYRITFLSYLEEDAYPAIISRLKLDVEQAKYPAKPVLQSLLAEMFWKYYEQNRYRFAQRSQLSKPDSDFRKWDIQTIITETSRLYRLSLADAKQEQSTPVNVLDGVLQGDTATRYLRPTLYDLLVQRAFEFYLADEPAVTKPRLPFALNDPAFFGDSRSFAALHVKTTDTASTYYQGIKYLQQATAFHLQMHQDEALADIDLKRLSFLYTKSNADHKDSLYLAALKQITSVFAQKPISSEALVLQGQYYQNIDSLAMAYGYYKQAATAYPQSLGGKNAAVLMKGIEQKEISASVENLNIPGKPLLALLNYKNVTSAHVAVYRLSATQLKVYTAGDTITTLQKYQFNFIKQLQPVQTRDLKWADKGDYRNHSAEFKLDGLPAGNYVLLVKDGASDDETLTGLTAFHVNKIAYMARQNPDENTELRIMDRETGTPLSGVQIAISSRYSRYDNATNTAKWLSTDDKGVSDKDGKFISDKFHQTSNLSFTFTIKGDTLTRESQYVNGASAQSGDDDDTTDRTVLFTDRQIYRPGQTIYFKGLQLQTFNGKSKIMPGKAEEVDFMDVNGKQVSALKLTTNDFGTFNGSFIIPQTMLNGDVNLKTADGDITIKVEEYKRPTFQVEFLSVNESYKLNDTITVKGKVTAFSGYGLSQAKVAYHITRSRNIVFMPYKPGVKFNYRNIYNNPIAEIKADTILTDNQGNYTIKFKAIPGDDENAKTTNYTYVISADVTDGSNETHSGQTSVTVGNNDIKIAGNLPSQVFTKDADKGTVGITNLNNQPEKGDIKVEIYALKDPGQLFKNRLWTKPDQYFISKPDFKADFPDYAYGNEDEFAAWPRTKLISTVNLKADTSKLDSIDLAELRKQVSGVYQVVVSARNEKGDTDSFTKYVNLIADPAKAASTADWVVPVLNSVKPGSNAEFLVGLNKKINVLVEHYSNAKLISSKWITVDKGQQSIKIPIAGTEKNAAVQFMTVCNNRMYNSYQKIYIASPDNNLKIKFLTFHNKLEPGQKEQWKLQVSGANNERLATEMVAALYDASLDDITPGQNWSHALDEPQKYDPNYFAWNDNGFINSLNTNAVSYANNNFSTSNRNYEQLNLFGYNYYGSYNSGYRQYLELAKINLNNAQRDKQLQDDYLKNARLIKNGYDITGTLKDAQNGALIPAATVTVKGTRISTSTSSNGTFRIKVPANATLVFSFIGYKPQEIATTKSEKLEVKIEQNAAGLNEVVIVGYGVQKRAYVTGSVTSASAIVRIRGVSSQSSVNSGYMSFNAKVAGLQVADPGAADKVVMREIRSKAPSPKPVTIRTNFNETAFFYPQMRTNDKGEILIDFTIPEALTKWRFEAFAHTQQLETGYIENTIVTQKQLSISANMPRFLREGDTLTVSARLANLTVGTLKGKATIQLFNALTMQPVNLLLNPADSVQQFEVGGNVNKAVSFKLIVPQGLDALTYRLTAEASNYSDGEENTLPVLPNRMLVTESLPMMVRAGQTRDYTFDKLLNNTSTTLKSKTLTLEYTQNPAWYAVQAIPYMMEFPYECSEQVFSRYYANSLATSLVNRMPVIKRIFDQWKNTNSTELLSNLEKNQDLKSTLLEETPWLKDATNESEQKKRIALLFDLNKMSNEMQLNLDKLQKRQLPDGGFTWFAGDMADRYITQHIIAGIGELYHLNIATTKDQELKGISDKAIQYMDDQLTTDDRAAKKQPKYETRGLSALEIHAWYARSYYANKMSAAVKSAFTNYLNRAEKQWVSQNTYEQGLIALTMLRNGKPLVSGAIIKSLKETAQQSTDMGMYWAKNTYGYFWYQSPIETQSLMIELFTEAGNNQKAVEEMKIWLLRSKQTSDWKTTKATAAACYALLLKQDDWLATGLTSQITLGGKPLEELKPDIKADAGTGYIKTSWADEQIKSDLGKVQIKNNGKSISWGALHWQYLEQLDKITPSQTDIHVDRKYFIVKQTSSGPVLTAVDATHQPKTGDLLKVVVYLKAGRDFEYVQLKDMRPAGTEPVDALSTYKYQDGLYYYQVTKDVATNFFISYLKKGNYVFEYQLRVAQPGDFSTGIATVQSMYAPEFNAHSEGSRIIFGM